MPRTIDVSGLPSEAVRAVESLVVFLKGRTTPSASPPSVFDLFGKAPRLRRGDDIARQLQEERDSWGEA